MGLLFILVGTTVLLIFWGEYFSLNPVLVIECVSSFILMNSMALFKLKKKQVVGYI